MLQTRVFPRRGVVFSAFTHVGYAPQSDGGFRAIIVL